MLYFLLFFSAFIVFFAMVGYPVLLLIMDKLLKPEKIKKNYDSCPAISYMIAAYNEEKVIKEKLINAISMDYPKDKLQIIVASDHSTDTTDKIVQEFINEHEEYDIEFFVTKERKSKTNAMNEAYDKASGDIIIMTDANSILEQNAFKEIVACYCDDNIVYVCGKLVYINTDNSTSASESTYWDLELTMRDIESRLQTITAGNGALFSCRRENYVKFEPIRSQDSMMPLEYAKQKKRALFNPDAVAYEKAGEVDSDEFKRKVRMNRDIFDLVMKGFGCLNFFKYKYFSLFYFGHRMCRYSLWFGHLIFFMSSILLAFMGSYFGLVLSILQLLFIVISAIAIKLQVENRVLHLVGYYAMTVFAQFVGVKNYLTGNISPIWQKAASTR